MLDPCSRYPWWNTVGIVPQCVLYMVEPLDFQPLALQEGVEALQTTVARLQDDLDLVYAKYKEQAIRLDETAAEAAALRHQLSAGMSAPEPAEVALVEALRSEAANSFESESEAWEEVERYQKEVSTLHLQVSGWAALIVTPVRVNQ